MLIASELVINESKRSANLFTENLIPPLPKPFQQPADKSKPQERPRKKLHIENKVEQDSSVNVDAL